MDLSHRRLQGEAFHTPEHQVFLTHKTFITYPLNVGNLKTLG